MGTYAIDPSHTELGFAVRHMAVSKVRGRLSKFEGTLVLAEDPARLQGVGDHRRQQRRHP